MSRFDIIAHLGRKKELTADLDYYNWEGSLGLVLRWIHQILHSDL